MTTATTTTATRRDGHRRQRTALDDADHWVERERQQAADRAPRQRGSGATPGGRDDRDERNEGDDDRSPVEVHDDGRTFLRHGRVGHHRRRYRSAGAPPADPGRCTVRLSLGRRHARPTGPIPQSGPDALGTLQRCRPATPRLHLSNRSVVVAVLLLGLTLALLRLSRRRRVLGWAAAAAIIAGLLEPLVRAFGSAGSAQCRLRDRRRGHTRRDRYGRVQRHRRRGAQPDAPRRATLRGTRARSQPAQVRLWRGEFHLGGEDSDLRRRSSVATWAAIPPRRCARPLPAVSPISPLRC